MKKICSLFLSVLIGGGSLFAQDNIEEAPTQDPSQEIWGAKNQSTLGAQASKRPPRDPNPIPTPVPFDGGIAVLIAAGALYGKKRLAENKRLKEK